MSYLFFPRITRSKISHGRLILVAAALVFSAMTAPACLGSDSDNLAVLERKFFEHTFGTDTQEARLDRLEKLVFGEIGQGNDADRIARLIAAVPDLSGKGPDPSNDPIPAAPPSRAAASSDNSATTGDSSEDAQSSSGTETITDSSDYPTVTAIEKQLLGKSFVGLPVQKRLDQLELHAFGKLSGLQDLSDRVDKLEDYVQNKVLHASKSNPSHPAGGSNAGGPAANATLEQQLSWLETQLLGQTYPNRTVIERLQPLEAAVFPTDPPDIHSSIPDQVHALVNAVELRLHTTAPSAASQPYGQQSIANYQSNGYRYPGNAVYNQQQASQFASYAQPSQQNYPQQYSQQTTTQPVANSTQNQGAPRSHPFLNGLAKALGAVGSMALSAVGSGNMMMGSGYGGAPGYYGGAPAGYYPGINW